MIKYVPADRFLSFALGENCLYNKKGEGKIFCMSLVVL